MNSRTAKSWSSFTPSGSLPLGLPFIACTAGCKTALQPWAFDGSRFLDQWAGRSRRLVPWESMKCQALTFRAAFRGRFMVWKAFSGKTPIAAGYWSDSSSSEDQPFDMTALARRLRVKRKDVKHVIENLQEQGLPRYEDDDHIPKLDAKIIAEFGFGKKLPGFELPHAVVGSQQERPEPHESPLQTDGMAGGGDVFLTTEEAELKVRLERACRTRPGNRLFHELRKEGFRMGGDRSFHVYSHSGKRHILTRPSDWDAVEHFPKLWNFVRAERWSGAFCERCRSWVEQSQIDHAVKSASTSCVPDGCVGTCDAARANKKS